MVPLHFHCIFAPAKWQFVITIKNIPKNEETSFYFKPDAFKEVLDKLRQTEGTFIAEDTVGGKLEFQDLTESNKRGILDYLQKVHDSWERNQHGMN